MAEFASKAVAGTGLGLGIAGTGLGLLNAHGGLLGGLFGGGNCCAENQPVNRYELSLVRENDSLKSQIALRDANTFTDGKIIELYKYVDGQLKDITQKINDNAASQAVINAQFESGMGVIGNQISSIQNTIANLTKTVIPNSSVCPGWGNVCVQSTGCSCPTGNI